MIISEERREDYRGYAVVAVPNRTVWGYRIEYGGHVVESRPNGALSPCEALMLAKSRVDEKEKSKE